MNYKIAGLSELCMSPKEIKKRNDEQVRDLKATINYLSKNNGYDKEMASVIGSLTARLIQINGPLK